MTRLLNLVRPPGHHLLDPSYWIPLLVPPSPFPASIHLLVPFSLLNPLHLSGPFLLGPLSWTLERLQHDFGDTSYESGLPLRDFVHTSFEPERLLHDIGSTTSESGRSLCSTDQTSSEPERLLHNVFEKPRRDGRTDDERTDYFQYSRIAEVQKPSRKFAFACRASLYSRFLTGIGLYECKGNLDGFRDIFIGSEVIVIQGRNSEGG